MKTPPRASPQPWHTDSLMRMLAALIPLSVRTKPQAMTQFADNPNFKFPDTIPELIEWLGCMRDCDWNRYPETYKHTYINALGDYLLFNPLHPHRGPGHDEAGTADSRAMLFIEWQVGPDPGFIFENVLGKSNTSKVAEQIFKGTFGADFVDQVIKRLGANNYKAK
jgi:hypothetical protein